MNLVLVAEFSLWGTKYVVEQYGSDLNRQIFTFRNNIKDIGSSEGQRHGQIQEMYDLLCTIFALVTRYLKSKLAKCALAECKPV